MAFASELFHVFVIEILFLFGCLSVLDVLLCGAFY